MPSYYAESAVNPVLLELGVKAKTEAEIAAKIGVSIGLVSITLEHLARDRGVPMIHENGKVSINPRDERAFKAKLPDWIREGNRRLSE